jgi:hypothetical protein
MPVPTDERRAVTVAAQRAPNLRLPPSPARLSAYLLLWLLTVALAWRLGVRHGGATMEPGPLGRETQPEMIGTRHPNWEIADVIARQTCRRRVDEVILHHSWRPTAAEYHGEPTIESILRYHVEDKHWRNIAYHYLVAPDGTVWLGCPLGVPGTHVSGQNEHSVGVCLILDGDVEPPSQVQITALCNVLHALFTRFHLDPAENFAEHKGFHRDYADKSCPGTKITKAMVLDWLANH